MRPTDCCRIVVVVRTGRLVHHTELMLDPKNESDYSGDPYAFGIDPVSNCCDILVKLVLCHLHV